MAPDQGWKATTLGECLAEPIRNGYSPRCPEQPNGTWVLSLGAVSESGFQPSGVKPAPPNDPQVGRFLLEVGDVLVSRSNTRERVGFAGLYRGVPERCSYPDLLMRVRSERSRLLPEFLERALLSPSGRRYFQQCARGTSASMVKIDRSLLEQFPLLLPPLAEQRKIAAILSSVDEAIEKTQAVIDQVQKVKKGLMQEVLTRGLPGRHTKFKQTEIGEVPEGWEVVHLGEVLTSIEAGWSPQCDSEPAGLEEWAILKVSSVSWGSFRQLENKRLKQGLEPRPEIAVRPGDLLVSRANTPELVGRAVLVDATRERLMLSDKIMRLMPDASRASPAYLAIVLETDCSRAQIIDRATGSSKSMKNISQEKLRDVRIPLPARDEQALICEGYRELRQRIGLEERQRQALEALKMTLMPRLLSGELRVEPEVTA